MAMNRQTKRMLQRQGQVGPDGTPLAPKREQRVAAAQQRAPRERVGPRQYVGEVRGELRKVAWPTREEVGRFSVIVLLTVIVLTAFIFAIDFGSARAIFFLFDQ
jgi:preprotein translocase subunit SecE